MIFLSLILSALLLPSDGNADSRFYTSPPAALVGGKLEDAGSPVAKSTVIVFLVDKEKKSTVELCSGTIIASDLVLTAAHCFDSYLDGRKGKFTFQIFFGNTDRADLVRAETTQFKIHPKAKTGDNPDLDLGLLKIQDGFQMPAGFGPAEIYSGDPSLQLGQSVIIAGYGPPDESVQSGHLYLRTLSTAVSKLNRSQVRLSCGVTHMPTGGDSGGPGYLVSADHLYLWGVHSFNKVEENSRGQTTKCYYSAFFSILGERAWLNDSAQELGSAARF